MAQPVNVNAPMAHVEIDADLVREAMQAGADRVLQGAQPMIQQGVEQGLRSSITLSITQAGEGARIVSHTSAPHSLQPALPLSDLAVDASTAALDHCAQRSVDPLIAPLAQTSTNAARRAI